MSPKSDTERLSRELFSIAKQIVLAEQERDALDRHIADLKSRHRGLLIDSNAKAAFSDGKASALAAATQRRYRKKSAAAPSGNGDGTTIDSGNTKSRVPQVLAALSELKSATAAEVAEKIGEENLKKIYFCLQDTRRRTHFVEGPVDGKWKLTDLGKQQVAQLGLRLVGGAAIR